LTHAEILAYCKAVFTSLLFLLISYGSSVAHARPYSTALVPHFPPCDPSSEIVDNIAEVIKEEAENRKKNSTSKTPFKNPIATLNSPSFEFCAKWNPDFTANGHQCCGKKIIYGGRFHRKMMPKCSQSRGPLGYCAEVTPEQKFYIEAVQSGRVPDVLAHLKHEAERRREQAFCTVNNGFLAYGRPVLGTPYNRLHVQSPERCLNFGTDAMAGMLEWVGVQIAQEYPGDAYSGLKLILGNISGPRGGCLIGRSGRRGHASHTSGQDADVGFLTVKKNGASPFHFHRQFDAKVNWWFIKKLFENPFACIKGIFLDRRHIRALERHARKDPSWPLYHRFIRHMPGHNNHVHIRIGNTPGLPGCSLDPQPELEFEEEGDSNDAGELSILDELSVLK
jgi:murein endopeptidase